MVKESFFTKEKKRVIIHHANELRGKSRKVLVSIQDRISFVKFNYI